jgi:hypothetical protein
MIKLLITKMFFNIIQPISCNRSIMRLMHMLCYFNQVRRGKINERLRCLQDIVPGCYKVNKFFIFGLKKKKNGSLSIF